jgi:hypothetical protein
LPRLNGRTRFCAEGLRVFETAREADDVLRPPILHGGNALRQRARTVAHNRSKPFIGDPAYDATRQQFQL